jgi:hypothetical protein
MTLDGFLTLLTLLAAIYALLSNADRLSLRLTFRWYDYANLLISFLIICYLEFYAVFKKAGFGSPIHLGSTGLTPGDAAFVVVFASAVAALISSQVKRIRVRDLRRLKRLVDEQINQRQFGDLLTLLGKSLPAITRAYERKSLLPFIRSKFVPTDAAGWQLGQIQARKRSWVRFVLIRAASYLPTGQRQVDEAHDIVRTVLNRQDFVEFVATNRPTFGIELMRHKFFEINEFVDRFLGLQMQDTRSALYSEVQHNQNISASHSYFFPETNHLLHFLFYDARRAYDLAVWKPVGNFLLYGAASPIHPEIAAFLNLPCRDFSESGQWQNAFFVGIRFFDLMVSAALHQGIRWHMWLYYYPDFVELLAEHYDATGATVDQDAEWPTKGAYLLYNIFDALTEWIQAVRDLPIDSPHANLENIDVDHENGNIVKSAIIALGMSIKYLFLSPNVSEKFEAYILDMCTRLYESLSHHERFQRHAIVLMKAIREGGVYLGSNKSAYRASVRKAVGRLDTVLRINNQEFCDYIST